MNRRFPPLRLGWRWAPDPGPLLKLEEEGEGGGGLGQRPPSLCQGPEPLYTGGNFQQAKANRSGRRRVLDFLLLGWIRRGWQTAGAGKPRVFLILILSLTPSWSPSWQALVLRSRLVGRKLKAPREIRRRFYPSHQEGCHSPGNKASLLERAQLGFPPSSDLAAASGATGDSASKFPAELVGWSGAGYAGASQA